MSTLADARLRSAFEASGVAFASAAAREGLVERVVRFGHHGVRLRVAGDGLAEIVLARLATRPVAATAAAGRASIEIATIAVWSAAASREPGGDRAPVPWRFDEIGPGGLVAGSDPAGIVAVHETGSDAITLAEPSRRAVLHRLPCVSDLRWWQRATPLRVPLFWAFGGDRCHLVHAGAVGDDRGAILLAGASGAGKTTATVAAVACGLGYLADDYALLETGGGSEATAIALYTGAHLDAGNCRRFASLGAAITLPHAADAGAKAVLDVAAWRPEQLRESLRVRAVVLPRICGGHSRLRPIGAARALLGLAPSTVFQMPFDGGSAVAALAELARNRPCFMLDVGDDVHELGATVERALAHA
jgi:hypothetical protein